ncbi:MAG: hypothetical protein K9G62_06525 [Alphaproteobacteria bacterium]|nr:hypothetical protein [Alphaproteobacteria bacterium]
MSNEKNNLSPAYQAKAAPPHFTPEEELYMKRTPDPAASVKRTETLQNFLKTGLEKKTIVFGH